MARQINPVPYSADYPRRKMHIDQNKKLVMYGATHVAAVDGYSGVILGLVTMHACQKSYCHLRHAIQVKTERGMSSFCNNLVLSVLRYQTNAQQFGLWDQLRVDHGREWCLLLHVQQLLVGHRYNTQRQPHIASTSTQAKWRLSANPPTLGRLATPLAYITCHVVSASGSKIMAELERFSITSSASIARQCVVGHMV